MKFSSSYRQQLFHFEKLEDKLKHSQEKNKFLEKELLKQHQKIVKRNTKIYNLQSKIFKLNKKLDVLKET